jgi:hypothetical protein
MELPLPSTVTRLVTLAPPEFKVGPVSVVFAGRVSPPLVSVIVVGRFGRPKWRS